MYSSYKFQVNIPNTCIVFVFNSTVLNTIYMWWCVTLRFTHLHILIVYLVGIINL